MGRRESFGKRQAGKKNEHLHRVRGTTVASSSVASPARLMLYYCTERGVPSPPITGLQLNEEDVRRMSLRQILDAKCPPTTLDLMLEEQKLAYLEHSCRSERIATAAEMLTARTSTDGDGGSVAAAERQAYPSALPRREDSTDVDTTLAGEGFMSPEMEKSSAIEREKLITSRISALGLNPGLLRHFVTMGARWQLPATESSLRMAARILLECGDIATLAKLHCRCAAIAAEITPADLVTELVSTIALPQHGESKSHNQVVDLLGLVEKLKVSLDCQPLVLDSLDYLVTCRSYRPLLRFTKSFSVWRFTVSWSWYVALLEKMFSMGDFAVAGQFCKFVNVPRLQHFYLEALTKTCALKADEDTAPGPHHRFGHLREKLAVKKYATLPGECVGPPTHPLVELENDCSEGDGMHLSRLASVFASQFKSSSHEGLVQLVSELVVPLHVRYYLPDNSITIVDSDQSLAHAIEYFKTPPSWTEGVDCIGLDMETEPSRVKGQRNPSSLLQVSSRYHTFIIDLLTLGDSCIPLIRSIFYSPHWIKVGLGFSGDLKGLRSSYPSWGCFDDIHLLLDINNVYRALHPSQTAIGDASLDKLCLYTFGRPIDKTFQCSNWAARPLSLGQQHYAALDALVLVHMFDVMRENLKRYAGTDIDHFVEDKGCLWQ